MTLGSIARSMKIRTRLYLGFSILIVLTLVLAVSGREGLTREDTEIGSLTKISANVRRVLNARNQLEIVRRAATRIVLDGDDASVVELHEAEAKTKSLLEEAAVSTLSQDRLAIYQGVLASLKEEGGLTDQVVDTAKAVRAGMAALSPAGEAMITATDKLIKAALAIGSPEVTTATMAAEHDIMMVRITSLRFQKTRTEKDLATFGKAAADAHRALDALRAATGARLNADIDATITAVDAYQSGLEKTGVAMLTLTKIYDQTLRPSLTAMQTHLAAAETSLIAATEAAEAYAHAVSRDTTNTQVAIAATAAAMGLLLAFVIARSILRPLMAMVGAMRTLAGGDLTVEVPERGSPTELGEMAQAMEVFKENGIARARMAEERERERAAREDRARRITELTASFESKAGDLVTAVSGAANDLLSTADAMGSLATQTTSDATDMAVAADQTSANVQTVATASEQLAASISEINMQVARSAEVTRRAREDAARTDGVVRALSESANRIGEVVGLIGTIAGQTNLLALNATIEAARAGEAGRGFAVVASEVKNLALKTAGATGEIESQVAAIQSATRDAVTSIQGIGRTIDEISGIASAIAAAVEEQGAATHEIARNVQQAAIGTQEVTNNIVGVSRRAGETSGSASRVQEAAGDLSQRADQIRKEVTSYIRLVQAA